MNKLKAVPKTELICLTCRKLICVLKNQLCFPKAYDFCPDCQERMLKQFERQYKR